MRLEVKEERNWRIRFGVSRARRSVNPHTPAGSFQVSSPSPSKLRDRPLSSVLSEVDLSESYRILHSSRNQCYLFPNAK